MGQGATPPSQCDQQERTFSARHFIAVSVSASMLWRASSNCACRALLAFAGSRALATDFGAAAALAGAELFAGATGAFPVASGAAAALRLSATFLTRAAVLARTSAQWSYSCRCS
jgi:hypothetical protein